MTTQDRGSVTVTWGEAVCSPLQYHSYRVGPFSVTVSVEDGETVEQALERAQRAVNAHAARMVKAAREFWEREWNVTKSRKDV